MNRRHSIPVFYEGQDDLVDILAVSICSVCYNTEEFIEFYILDCGISEISKRLLLELNRKFSNFSIEFIPVDLSPFNGLKGWPIGSSFLDCYSRLLIPELKKNIDRAIYLDSDVIALNDIKTLWEENLEGYELGACPDLGYNSFFWKNCVNNLHVHKDHVYANAGVLLLDCAKMRQNKSTAHFISIAKQFNEHIQVIIEDIFSIYYNGNNYKILPSRYNIPDRSNEINSIVDAGITDDYIRNEWKNVVFQHLSPGKAWKFLRNGYNGRDLKFYNIFWFYAAMTPFYAGMANKFLYNTATIHTGIFTPLKRQFKLFNLIPIMKKIRKGNTLYYKLFNFIPILKIKESHQ
ncbi:MAG: hypothetical protein IJB29_05080 [Mailhella sp.]|nr:hypothetical protein [Mailhella sp.]